MDYYALLEVSKCASLEEIKKAFRKKLKRYHPDLRISNNDTSNHQNNLVDIINAYNVLSSPLGRKYYDANNTDMSIDDDTVFYRPSNPKPFNYEMFLLSKQNRWEYQVKLFVYDLVFCNGNRAVKIYEYILVNNLKEKLKNTLGFYDYFDCMFLVAEYYQKRAMSEDIIQSLTLYYEITILETQKSYFKSYMEEVTDRVLLLIRHDTVKNNYICIKLLDSLLSSNISIKQKKQIFKLQQ